MNILEILDEFLHNPLPTVGGMSYKTWPVEYFFYLFKGKCNKPILLLKDIENYNSRHFSLLGDVFMDIVYKESINTNTEIDHFLIGSPNRNGDYNPGLPFNHISSNTSSYDSSWKNYEKAEYLWPDFNDWYYIEGEEGEIKHRKNKPQNRSKMKSDDTMSNKRLKHLLSEEKWNNDQFNKIRRNQYEKSAMDYRQISDYIEYDEPKKRKIRGMMEYFYPNFNREYEFNPEGNVQLRGLYNRGYDKLRDFHTLMGFDIKDYSTYINSSDPIQIHPWEKQLISEKKSKEEYDAEKSELKKLKEQNTKSIQKQQRAHYREFPSIFERFRTENDWLESYRRQAREDIHLRLDTKHYEDTGEHTSLPRARSRSSSSSPHDDYAPHDHQYEKKSFKTLIKDYKVKINKGDLICKEFERLFNLFRSSKVEFEVKRKNWRKFMLTYHPDKITLPPVEEVNIAKIYLILQEEFKEQEYQNDRRGMQGKHKTKRKCKTKRKRKRKRKDERKN